MSAKVYLFFIEDRDGEWSEVERHILIGNYQQRRHINELFKFIEIKDINLNQDIELLKKELSKLIKAFLINRYKSFIKEISKDLIIIKREDKIARRININAYGFIKMNGKETTIQKVVKSIDEYLN